MLEINKEIADRYNLDIKYVVPYKDAFIISTPKGKKLLKKSDMIPARILFIHGVKEHLFKNNFNCIDRYLCTTDGEPYITIESDNYTIADYAEGTECNFDSREEIIKASKLLALMHKASKGYIPPQGSMVRDDLGKLPQYFSKRLDEIKKLKKVAKKGRSKFDYLFLEYIDYFYGIGEDAINKIYGSKYEDIVNAARNEGAVCHHDYNHNNIVCSAENMSIINFDYCCFELKVYDIANLLRRKMRKCNWDISEAAVILNEYRALEPVSDDEFKIMKIMLQFPQKFWRVANKYYNSRRSWSEKSYVSKLQEVIDEVKYHKGFMQQLDGLG